MYLHAVAQTFLSSLHLDFLAHSQHSQALQTTSSLLFRNILSPSLSLSLSVDAYGHVLLSVLKTYFAFGVREIKYREKILLPPLRIRGSYVSSLLGLY